MTSSIPPSNQLQNSSIMHQDFLTVPGRAPDSRVLTDPTSGYKSTPFEGKEAQLDAGKCFFILIKSIVKLTNCLFYSYSYG